MPVPNPPAVPRTEQTIEHLAARITPAKRELIEAVVAGTVVWHYPAGAPHATTTRRIGRKSQVCTGEANWLRSHGLAMLGSGHEHRPLILTTKGRLLFDALPPHETT